MLRSDYFLPGFSFCCVCSDLDNRGGVTGSDRLFINLL
jgi:hypothetical protein